MKKILLIILALLMCFQCVSCKKNQEQTETESEPDPTYVIDIVKNKQSDYVIVYNASDDFGRDMADRVWQMLNEIYGVALKIRTDDSEAEHEILIGNTCRDATEKIKERASAEEDYAIAVEGDDLVLYATDGVMAQRMLVSLTAMLKSNEDEENLTMTDLDNYIYSENPDGASKGSEVVLFENGATDCSIVYSAGQNGAREAAAYLARQLRAKTGVSYPTIPDTENADAEILIGSGVNRSQTKMVNSMLDKTRDFAICVSEGKLVLAATDNEQLFMGVMKLVDSIDKGQERYVLSELDNYVHSIFGYQYSPDRDRYISEYQKVYNTFSSVFDEYYSNFSLTVKADQELIEALVERMGDSVALYGGSSIMLYRGFVQTLDKTDYTLKTKISLGKVMIPAAFAEEYFGEKLTKDSDGYVDITSYCNASDKYSLYYDSFRGLAIITPANVTSFSSTGKVNGYTNEAYITKMVEFFTSKALPEPENNSEQSRVVIEFSEYNRNVPDYRTQKYQACASPSITKITEGGKTVLYVSYELSTVRKQSSSDFTELDTVAVVKRSADNGKTWTEVGRVDDVRWATAQEVNGELYLFGNNIHTGDAVVIHKTASGKLESAAVASKVGYSGPTSVLVAKGRVYKAYNERTISAPVTANLLDPASWTVSNSIYTVANLVWLQGATGTGVKSCNPQECNMVLGKDGVIYNIFRFDDMGRGYAGVLKLSDDGTTYSLLDGNKSLIKNFPTAVSKFMIKYDEATGKYICLSNVHGGPEVNLDRHRRVLAISVSDDLINWETKDYLLVEREMINENVSSLAHAWQYPDFVIDGDNLYYVVRESSGDASNWHDSNYVTFYTLSDYKNVIA